MYGSPAQRASEIEEGSRWPAEQLRRFLREQANELSSRLEALTSEEWERTVVTAQGRNVKATEIPWLRAREVFIHSVDLAAGLSFADLPPDFCEALVTDVASLRSRRGDVAALALRSPSGRAWPVAGSGEPAVVEGQPWQLAQWLTGRGTPEIDELLGCNSPMLTPWI